VTKRGKRETDTGTDGSNKNKGAERELQTGGDTGGKTVQLFSRPRHRLQLHVHSSHSHCNFIFSSSPIEADEKDIIKLAKKLKKEKVNIDIVSFGEDEVNNDILNKFITTINGKEGTGSHLVTIPPGPHLSDALVSSPIVQVMIV